MPSTISSRCFFRSKLNWVSDPFLQEVPGNDHTENPGNTTYHIEEGELLPIHIYNTSHNRSECSYDRQETGKYNGAATMFFIKIMRIV